MPETFSQPIHLTAAGVSVLLTPTPAGVPILAYWGPALGELTSAELAAVADLHRPGRPHSALDEPRYLGLLPDNAAGYTGPPALDGFRPGSTGARLPRLLSWAVSVESGPSVRLLSEDAGWLVSCHLELTREGLLRTRVGVENTGSDALVLTAARMLLPVPAYADELLDLTGRWCHERAPQRRPWQQGTHRRDGRHGRTGHDATLLLVAGEAGFGFGHGQVWGTHVAWSGNHESLAHRTPEGESLLGGGELLEPGEIVLAPGETYQAPWVVGSCGAGLDEMSARLHQWTRRVNPRSRSQRKVLVNTWEASYFDHDLAKLTELAEAAAAVGVERFVLDDGWFTGRRHDQAGLGDWQVDPAVWPQGLTPLIERVHDLGMDFGLWVEPEMINLDSDLARSHPDWILRGRDELPLEWRYQQVLDLQVPGAYTLIRDALIALLDEYDIAYLKWDHNRDLIDVHHDGRGAVHGQTLAFYRLLDELRAAHPEVEIESCASGGGRVDLEVLTRTERIWASDTIDALERQQIQRWTSLLVAPELIGAHLGAPHAHTTGRTLPTPLRAATALLGHYGIEWNLTTLSPAERAQVAGWIDLHKQLRGTLATGTLVRGDHPDPAVLLTGTVAADRSEGWYVVAVVDVPATQTPSPVRLPGLDPTRRYEVSDVTPADPQHSADQAADETGGPVLPSPVTVPGSVLGQVGVRLPVSAPQTVRVIRVRNVTTAG